MSRTKNSLYNSITGALSNLVNIVISFITRKVFVVFLGLNYLGINGVFTNVLSILSIAELGIGEAIIFNLYKPVAQNDIGKVRSLMVLYRRAYGIIVFLILLLGLLLLPFVDIIVGETDVQSNVRIVYLLFLAQTVASYFLTYKRSIVFAIQKNYILNIVHIGCLLLLNITQIIVLWLTRDYYLFLSSKIVFNLLENIIINFYVDRNYPEYFSKSSKMPNKSVTGDIFRRIRAMGLHKIGSFIVNGTDNILISQLFGLDAVGLYSNYYLITNAMTQLFSQIVSSSTASIGNLLVENNAHKNYVVYKKIRFLNYYIAVVTSSCLIAAIEPVIVLWLGESFLLPMTVTVVIVINYYQKLMRKTYDSFMIAAGICVENRFVPIIESVLNIVFSIVFAKMFGLVGIFIGTVMSGLALWLYSYPWFMYKLVLHRRVVEYFCDFLKSLALFISISGVVYLVSSWIKLPNLIFTIILRVSFSFTMTNLVLILIYSRNSEFRFYVRLIKRVLLRRNKQ